MDLWSSEKSKELESKPEVSVQSSRKWEKLQKLAQMSKFINVEPMALLFGLGMVIYMSLNTTVIYQKICHIRFAGSGVDCLDLNAYPAAQDAVQQEATTWSLANTLSSTIPSIPAVLLWTARSDRNNDVKFLLLLGMVGFVLQLTIVIVEASIASAQLWLMPLVNAIAGFTGLFGLVMNSFNIYINRTTKNPRFLMIRFMILTTIVNLASIIGNSASGALQKLLTIPQTLTVAMGFLLASALYVFFAIRNPPPLETTDESPKAPSRQLSLQPLTKNMLEGVNSVESDGSGSNIQPPPRQSVFSSAKQLLKDVWLTFTKRREGHTRLYILLTLLCYFLSGTSDMGLMGTQNIFMYRRPLTFTPSTYAVFTGASSAIHMVVGLVVTTSFKLSHWSDLSLINISLVSNLFGFIILAASRYNWMVWLSTVIGSMRYLSLPATTAFLIQITEKNEHGKIIAGTGIVTSISSLLSTFLTNYIYGATEEWFAGFAFAIFAGLVLIALIIQVGVQIALKRANKDGELPSVDPENIVEHYIVERF